MSIRALDFIKPFVPVLPEVELPISADRLPFDDKVIYSVAACCIYLLCGLPLVGVKEVPADPFQWLRPTFASEPGTLLELGVLPVLTSAFIWQILAGVKAISVNFDSRIDREHFQSLQKLSAIVLSFVYAVGLLASGYFEPSKIGASLSLFAQCAIVAQIVLTNTFICLVVEVIDKGYGFSSGSLLFIASSCATSFVSNALGLRTVVTNRGTQSQGAIINLVRSITTKKISSAVLEAFSRPSLPNLNQIYLAVFTAAIVMAFNNYRVELPIKMTKTRSVSTVFPVKLLYCGALPLLFTYTVLYNLHIVTFVISHLLPSNTMSFLVGSWEADVFTGVSLRAKSGISFFLSPTWNGEAPFLFNMVRIVSFVTFVVYVSVQFAKTWTAISGSSPADIAKQFKQQDIVLVGHRDTSATKELSKIIPVAATTGSIILGLAGSVFEVLGGNGLCMSLLVGIVSGLNILESVMGEWQQQGGGGSQLASYLGQ